MRAIAAIGFILAATSLVCWLFASGYWVFDPFIGMFVFLVLMVLIGLLGFLLVEEGSTRA